MTAFLLEGTYQYQFKMRRRSGFRKRAALFVFPDKSGGLPTAAMIGCQKIFDSRWRFNLRQPRRAALFDGFNRHLLPFLPFDGGVFFVELRHHAFGQQRHDAPRTEFNGFLDDAFDNFSLGHGLQQCDGAGQGGREIFQRHGKRNGMARTGFDRTKEFISDTVQNGDELAAFQTQNMQRVMCLASVEAERIASR